MKKSLLMSMIALILLTAVLAAVHLTTRTPDAEGEIVINGKSVKISELNIKKVTGSIVNGKGEITQIDSYGIALSDICSCSVTVTASDEYSAEIAADKLKNAYLITDEDTLHLIVFGDENSKRNVKNVVRIDFR